MKPALVTRKLSFCAVILFAAVALPPGATHRAPGLAGSQPFLVVLCRFADAPDNPEPPAFFERLLFGPAPALDNYWRAVSGERINLAGSRVVDWVSLPQPAAGYAREDGPLARGQLAADCLAAAGVQRAARDFAGIALVFNQNIGPQPCAGELDMTVDAVREHHRVIWMPPGWMRNLSAWAHEMGHVFGLDHSSDSSNGPYVNPWDIMSGMGGCACGSEIDSIPQFPIADDLRRLGWIDAAREVVVGTQRELAVDLAPLSRREAHGALLIRIPSPQDGRYYTVEARARAGYDEHLPGDAVIIHGVDPACPDHPAHLVTHPGEPLTAAAGMWRAGETFTDAAGRVAISVEARRGVGFRVTVRTGRDAATATLPDEPDDVGAAPIRWADGKLRALNIAAGATRYALAAQETILGMSPGLTLAAWRDGEWTAAERLPGGWSSREGNPPVAVVAADGTLAVAWAGAAGLFPASGYGGITEDIWLARLDAQGWSAPRRVNDDAGLAPQLRPALAGGPGGVLFMAWQDQREGRRDIYFAEIAADGRVRANRRINDDTGDGEQGSPALAADAQGNVTIVWEDWRSGAPEVYTARRAAGEDWGANERLTAAGLDLPASPAVTADGPGNVYAAWVAYPACRRARGEVGAVMAAVRPARGAWLPAETIAAGVRGGQAAPPAIAATRDGRVFLAWEEQRGPTIIVRVAQYGADGWAETRSFETGASALAKPALAASYGGAVYLGWLAADGVGFLELTAE
jgi:hypothetical protein